MTAEPHIDYEALIQAAMRGMVRTILVQVAKTGLPGEHHFYIAFNTRAPGVTISKRLKEKYPEEMTIVLQHRFWDLLVQDERFEVKLTFDAIPERLVVPYSAIKVFWDPSVPYGHQFEESELVGDGKRRPTIVEADNGQDLTASAGANGGRNGPRTERTDKRRPASRKPRGSEKTAGAGLGEAVTAGPESKPVAVASGPVAVAAPVAQPGQTPALEQAKVISLDKFRKK